MKSLLTTLTTIMAFGLLVFSAPVLAQTPDGETPANEGVCDPLQENGVTKGLYGLCVAFCEAQDHASVDEPITEEELEALSDTAPAGRILENYYKKWQTGDPDMPCIKVEEPCPCWTSAELDVVALNASNEDLFGRCHRWEGSFHNGSRVSSYDQMDISNTFTRAQVVDHEHGSGNVGRLASCLYQDFTTSPRTQRSLRISVEEHAACDAQVRAAQDEFGLSCSSSN